MGFGLRVEGLGFRVVRVVRIVRVKQSVLAVEGTGVSRFGDLRVWEFQGFEV